ncbi:MAG: AAA family ATPase [Arhodomonas sp.]|nr:AAA family ATPase [Arhodomonas sp.]
MAEMAQRGRIGGRACSESICSFCGRTGSSLSALVAVSGASICAVCLGECARILETPAGAAEVAPTALPKPREIHDFLDGYVIGHEHAKRCLSVAVYNHYKRLRRLRSPAETEIGKSNVLLLGPSGTGKTLLAETLARTLEVPFVSIDATALTEAGYVGDDVDIVAERLLQAAGGDVSRAGCGIVYIDEVDKLAARGEGPAMAGMSPARASSRPCCACSRAAVSPVPQARRSPRAPVPELDTREVLFICGGAFAGLGRVMAGRRHAGGIGFAATPTAPRTCPGRPLAMTSSLMACCRSWWAGSR